MNQGHSLIEVLVALLLLSLFALTTSFAISSCLKHAAAIENQMNDQAQLHALKLYDLLSSQI